MKINDFFKNFFNKKENAKDIKLLEDYNKGKILQVDNKINNKEFLNDK